VPEEPGDGAAGVAVTNRQSLLLFLDPCRQIPPNMPSKAASRCLLVAVLLCLTGPPAQAFERPFLELAHGQQRQTQVLGAPALVAEPGLRLRERARRLERLGGLGVSRLNLPGDTLVATLGDQRRVYPGLDLQVGLSGILALQSASDRLLTGEGLGVDMKLRYRPVDWLEAGASLAYARLLRGSLLPGATPLERGAATLSLRWEPLQRWRLETSLTRRSEREVGVLRASLRYLLD
jgi:hypothetical protein